MGFLRCRIAPKAAVMLLLLLWLGQSLCRAEASCSNPEATYGDSPAPDGLTYEERTAFALFNIVRLSTNDAAYP